MGPSEAEELEALDWVAEVEAEELQREAEQKKATAAASAQEVSVPREVETGTWFYAYRKESDTEG